MSMTFTTRTASPRRPEKTLPLHLSLSPLPITSSIPYTTLYRPKAMARAPRRDCLLRTPPPGPRRTSILAKAPEDTSLSSLTDFMNANLVFQKSLKLNNTQITKAVKDFQTLKSFYEPDFKPPPTTTDTDRNEKYSGLLKLCARYENLLEVRRQILEKQVYWLEEALSAPVVKDSGQLGLAIDIQIEAAKDLAKLQKERKLKTELEALRKSTTALPSRAKSGEPLGSKRKEPMNFGRWPGSAGTVPQY